MKKIILLLLSLILSGSAVASEVPCSYCDSLYRASIAEPEFEAWDLFRKGCLQSDTVYYLNEAKTNSKKDASYLEITSKNNCNTFHSFERFIIKKVPSENIQAIHFEIFNDDTINYIDKDPEFIGGDNALGKFIGSNLKYPLPAEKKGIQGTVWVKFFVERTGKVLDISLLKSVHELLDNETMRVIGLMPNWNPKIYRGKPMRTEMKLPTRFVLQEEE